MALHLLGVSSIENMHSVFSGVPALGAEREGSSIVMETN